MAEIVRRLAHRIFGERFRGSREYWEDRYARGGNSGAGSYAELATFKATILNGFVVDHHIDSVIEFGCGDGHQLSLAEYPKYLGFDVSETAIHLCKQRFESDETKKFELVSQYVGETASLVLSLDVIYHLIEDNVFDSYMRQLFDASTRFVIIYSSNFDQMPDGVLHVRHRKFTKWIDVNCPNWQQIQHIKNAYPYQGDNRRGSHADFYVFEVQQK